MLENDSPLERGLGFHRAGNLPAAAEIYRQILSENPNQPDALYLLGCLAHQTGNGPVAVGLLGQAISIKPQQAEYYNALGSALAKIEDYGPAELNFRQAIRLGSRPEFHTSLGKLLKQQERFEEAIAEFESALRLSPHDAGNHYNLGKAYQAAGKSNEAILSFERALEIRPGDVRALTALRQALRAANRNDDALIRLREAIAPIGPDADRLCDLGDALQQAGDFVAAVEVYRQALTLDAGSSRAWYSSGCAEIARQEFAPAISCFEKALGLRPEWLEARHNLARALYEMGQAGPAYDQFKLCASRPEEAASPARAMIAVIVPGVPEADNQAVLEARRAWVDRDLSFKPATEQILRAPSAHHRLKIGYVSSFFGRDNWMKPVWALINQHDRIAFELHLFSDAPQSRVKYGYRAHPSDHFFDTSELSNQALAELIQKCGIQVLIDLNGYSDMKRLPMFMLRPAPVIAGWFNMYATTGMPCFDYLIGDREVIPPEEEVFYTENIQRVSGSYLTFTVDYPVPTVAEPPWMKNSTITFGCLGSQYKITSDVVEAWSRILKSSPGSTLLLKNRHLESRSARDFLCGMFAAHGVAAERLRFEGPEDHFEFLKAYDRIDLALDTFPYNGGTTTTEAIWQGVPVLTFRGDRWASRTSASILRAGGLGEFVADNLEGFISLASRWANSPGAKDRLSNLRATMRDHLMASRACDAQTFAREMEGIYRTCWKSRR